MQFAPWLIHEIPVQRIAYEYLFRYENICKNYNFIENFYLHETVLKPLKLKQYKIQLLHSNPSSSLKRIMEIFWSKLLYQIFAWKPKLFGNYFLKR